jgi:hypothetical protein
LLGFDYQRFDAGERLKLERPPLDALLRLIEPDAEISAYF